MAFIPLRSYGRTDTVADLQTAMDHARKAPGLATQWCFGCGSCCSDSVPVLGADLELLPARMGLSKEEYLRSHTDLPEPPNLVARDRGIRDLMRSHGISHRAATLVYEANQAEPITFRRSGAGACVLLHDYLCSDLSRRVFVCSLYICAVGDRLEALYDQTVRQGIWHSYQLMGWIPAETLSHNPFVGVADYGAVPLRALDCDLREALDSLFFYF